MVLEKSLLSMYDECVRREKALLQNDCTTEFLIFVKNQEHNKLKWRESVLECKRLKAQVDHCNLKISDLEKKLNRARVLLDSEKKHTLQAEAERDELRDHVAQIEILLASVRRAGDKLATGTKEQLDKFLSTTHSKIGPGGDFVACPLDTIDEINSTGSLLSELSYTRSEDNIDVHTSILERGPFKKTKRSPSPQLDEGVIKRRRSSRTKSRVKKIHETTTNHLVATTTVTVPKAGPVTACSKIETFPEFNQGFLEPSAPPETASETESEPVDLKKHYPLIPAANSFTSNKLFTRSHCFRTKTMLKPSEECGVCMKKIAFSNKFIYCPDCRIATHPECRDRVPQPCITVVETPRGAVHMTVGDYCSKSSPMVPPLIVHCVIEVECRGLTEVGIYRVPGSEREVKALKDRFIRGKGICSLSSYDIHVVCGVIKDFLRSLSEPLVTYSLWSEFIRAAELSDVSERRYAFYQVVGKLPQPNRDTMAFLMQHLQRVSESPDCKMSISNLAKVFGPTIVGYSSLQLENKDMYTETNQQAQVIEHLLNLPKEYWHNFINEENYDNVHIGTPIIPIHKRTRKNHKMFSTPPIK